MDRLLLLTVRGLRAFGFGFAAVLIGIHLERRGLSPGLIGLTLGVGLAGLQPGLASDRRVSVLLAAARLAARRSERSV